MLYLGLDIGTTNVKVLVNSASGTVVSQASAAVLRYQTPDGGVEQDINQIWQATCTALKQATSKIDVDRIKAIGVSAQGGALFPGSIAVVGPELDVPQARGGQLP